MLIIEDIHRKFHFGVGHVLSTLRSKYWLPKGRQNVKLILNKCIVCKRLQSRNFSANNIPPLPTFRVSVDKPFSATCIDYTGALLVKQDTEVVKYYVCFFTCATTRAIHLKLVENLSAEAFIGALRRFSGRRSYPKVIISDNATNFNKGKDIVHEILSSQKTVTTLLLIILNGNRSLLEHRGWVEFTRDWVELWSFVWRKFWETLW